MLFVKGGPLTKMPRVAWNWERCLDLQQSTGLDRILPLNGYRALVPCYFSPLLTRGKVIHTYESDVARNFRKIALGDANTAETTLRLLGITRFYVQKENCDFWVTGFSELFRPSELKERFAVYRESADYWILTWKRDAEPLSDRTAADISQLITRSREIYREGYGIEPIERLKHPLTFYDRKGNIRALEQLFKCG
jgi:hypothetical protein